MLDVRFIGPKFAHRSRISLIVSNDLAKTHPILVSKYSNNLHNQIL